MKLTTNINIKKCRKQNYLLYLKSNLSTKKQGQVVKLTTTCGSYKELGKYLTEMEKKQWRMLKVTRKES